MPILVIAEHDNAVLKPATLNTVACATRIGGDVHVLVAGSDCAGVAQAATKVAGVTKVLIADAPHYADQTAENLAALVVANAGGYTHVLAPATAFGKNVAPRIAALLDVAQISGVVAVVSPDTFVRPIYAGSVLATVKSSDAVKVVTVSVAAFAAVGQGGGATIESVAAGPDLGLTQLIGRASTRSPRPELCTAQVVVAGGRGLASAANYRELLEPLADKLGAALGASRAAVDAGFAPNDHQIGQTGKTVAPQLYIAIGLSGAIQHLAGMRDSKVIVAINKDAEAPIFQVADYGLVADLFQAVPKLTRALSGDGYIPR